MLNVVQSGYLTFNIYLIFWEVNATSIQILDQKNNPIYPWNIDKRIEKSESKAFYYISFTFSWIFKNQSECSEKYPVQDGTQQEYGRPKEKSEKIRKKNK